jgi:hypothetical protein
MGGSNRLLIKELMAVISSDAINNMEVQILLGTDTPAPSHILHLASLR